MAERENGKRKKKRKQPKIILDRSSSSSSDRSESEEDSESEDDSSRADREEPGTPTSQQVKDLQQSPLTRQLSNANLELSDHLDEIERLQTETS